MRRVSHPVLGMAYITVVQMIDVAPVGPAWAKTARTASYSQLMRRLPIQERRLDRKHAKQQPASVVSFLAVVARSPHY